MTSRSKIPDSWDDDDWVNKVEEEPSKEPAAPAKKLTKAERRALQAEFNRQLWQEAEAPEAPYYVESRNEAPLQSTLKSSVTLLARKPAPSLITRKDPVTGIEKLTLEDDENDDEEEKPNQMTTEERMLKAQKEREEKQKRYEEARERLFGPSKSGDSSPRSSTPPARVSERGRGRGRGAAPRENRDSRQDAQGSSKARQLYDPNSGTRSDGNSIPKKGVSELPPESPIIRNPRGPDGSGRGGFGFASRGDKAI